MAKKSRASGEGSITKRADGRWMGRLSVQSDDPGKTKRVCVYGDTQEAVVSKLESLRQQRRLNAKSLLAKDSLGAFLKRWLADEVEINRAGKTHQEYALAVRLYIDPYLAAVPLKKLDGDTLVDWQAKLVRKGYSANTRMRAIRILRRALNRAKLRRLIQFNPMDSVEKPRVVRKEKTPLDPEQCHSLFELARQNRVGDMIILAATTGLRKGELFGLHWSDVNLTEGFLVVRRTVQELSSGLSLKEPKTAAGRRMVTLGKDAIAALKNRLAKALEEGFDTDSVPIVFPSTLGRYYFNTPFDRSCWYPIRKAAELPDGFCFHDLRHTMASLMLDAGVDLKVIQKRLGHADFNTTANIYAHLMPGAQAEATEKVDRLLDNARPKKKS